MNIPELEDLVTDLEANLLSVVTELEKYKETIKMIRSVCVDYRDRPVLGLAAIKTLCKGVK